MVSINLPGRSGVPVQRKVPGSVQTALRVSLRHLPENSNLPAGYIHAGTDDSHDLGYGLLQEFWHRGFATEAARAVVARLKKDGMPYITATHDIRNPRSGGVMKQLGMRYQYSYEELWQPKNIPVTFRMYQLNLDGQEDRVYQEYWNRSSVRFKETGI